MPGTTRPVTLRFIADSLGLHVSTVSRVLNGAADSGARAASGDTAQRIRRLAAELGYRPNPHAASLRTERSDLIGVLVPRLSDLVLGTVYEGIEEAAAEHGLCTFVTNTHDDPQTQRKRTKMVLDRRVDGLIFGDAHADGRFLDEIARVGPPFVLVSRHAGDYPAITCDDYLGGGLVAEHLLDLGHEDVAVIACELYASTAIDRAAGFVDCYREAGVTIPAHHIIPSHFDTAGGREAAEQIFSVRRPSAIFATNDFAAIGASGSARDHGLLLGTDIAIVGFNDTPLAAELPIPLTTVRSPMREMGRRAAESLVRLLGGERIESQRLRPTLMVRASTSPAGRTAP